MAGGGDLRRSINIGSDVLYDFSCTPCAKNNTNEEAERYCVECREYFCVSCLKNHNNFAIMRNHKILDKAVISTMGPQQTSDMGPQQTLMVLTETCQVHHGSTINTYCPIHQVVGCGTCIALNHGSCPGIAYIPKVAQGFKKSKEYKDIKPAIKSSIKQLEIFKTTMKTDLEDLQKGKDVNLKMIIDYRKSIEIELDRMEKKITNEVHAKYKILQAEVNTKMKSIEDTMSKLESILKNLESLTEENEADLFINVKDGNIKITESTKLLQTLNDISGKKTAIQFKQNRAIDECLKKYEKLGELLVHKLCSTSLTSEYNVKVKTDTETCYIRNSTFLDDRTLLITDGSNKKIKRLNSSFQVTDYCDFSDSPHGMCVTGDKEVAVALKNEKKVQYVSVGKRLKPSRSFTTIGECIGLAYSKKNIIVANFKSNDVHVYSENGKCLRTITIDISGFKTEHVLFPCISLSTDHSKLLFSKNTSDIITVSMKDGHNVWVCTERMTIARGLCVLENDNILVADVVSNKIFEITGDGHMLGAVAQDKDGIEDPITICVDKANSRLIVTSHQKDKIQVFKMKINYLL